MTNRELAYKELQRLMELAHTRGQRSLKITARELHDATEFKAGSDNQMPPTSDAMWDAFHPALGDREVYAPKKKRGGRLEFEFKLP